MNDRVKCSRCFKFFSKVPLQTYCTSNGDVICDTCFFASWGKGKAGQKHDSQKPRYSLLPEGTISQVVDVLELGAVKYSPNNWQKVENPRERYYNAIMRHLTAWWEGEEKDPESGKSHLAHVACSVLFLMWFDD